MKAEAPAIRVLSGYGSSSGLGDQLNEAAAAAAAMQSRNWENWLDVARVTALVLVLQA